MVENYFNTHDELMEFLQDRELEDTVYLTKLNDEQADYVTAIIGVTDEGTLVYDYNKMVEYLMNTDNMSYEDAVEWIDYNTIRTLPYMGIMKPVIMYPIEY